MRDRQRTIDALRRLAERPGTPAEGETARRKLRELEAQQPAKPAPPKQSFEGVRYVVTQDEFDMEMLKSILRNKAEKAERNRRVPEKPIITWEDMESVIRRSIFRNTPDED